MNMSLVQHDPKNSGGRQYSKVNDHPAFQQSSASGYRESLTGPSSRPGRSTVRRESSSSASSPTPRPRQLHESAEPYSSHYASQSTSDYPPHYFSESDADRGSHSYDTGSGTIDYDISKSHPSEEWDIGHISSQLPHRRRKGYSKYSDDSLSTKHTTNENESRSYHGIKDMKDCLAPQDYSEIKKLHSTYSQSFNNIAIPQEDIVINESNLGVYYSYFLQSRAKFLSGIPLYKSLDVKDRKTILQIAVSMSTYIVGAQYVDLDNHVIENKDNSEDQTNSPVMPISTIRQFLTNDQFVEVMMFFSNHSSLYSDMIVSILMQIMGLTYPEQGLTNSVVLEAGRCHYGGLLSRYLTAVHGSEKGQQHFHTLLESQHEARKLVGMLQHLELVHQAPQRDNSSIKKILGSGIRLVYDEAREGLSKSRQDHRYTDGHQDYYAGKFNDIREHEETGASGGDASNFHIIEHTLQQLARCDDPAILAEARRILPVDLLKRFSDQLQDP